MRVSLVCLMVVIGAAIPPSVGAQAVSVSPSGTPVFGYPIVVPPGIAGMVPNLALQYSSGINGPVGVGWSLQGISMITRCPNNKRIDGVARNVEYDVNDKLCLDGQRLIRTDASGSPSAQGVAGDAAGSSSASALLAEYRTEKDIYARIRAYGGVGGGACPACGPGYFKVWTKSGQVFEYGVKSNTTSNATITALINVAGASSGPAIAWPVSRITDTAGNYIDFQYDQRIVSAGSWLTASGAARGREWNLTEIRYTGTATQAPVNRITFDYSDRPLAATNPDVGESYHARRKSVSVRRLDFVRTYINWPANPVNVKTYKLGYDISTNTKRSRLISIAECAGDTTKCMPPTRFEYTPGGSALYTTSQAFNTAMATLPLIGNTQGVLLGNFMGTGRTDIMRWSDALDANSLYQNLGGGQFSKVTSGTGTGQFNILDQNLFSTNGCHSAVAADFNGDGVTDILRVMRAQTKSGASCGTVRHILYLSRADGSFAASDVTGIDLSQIEAVVTDTYRCSGDIELRTRARQFSQLKLPTGNGGYQAGADITSPGTPTNCPVGQSTIFVGRSQEAGSAFHLMDVNNDGLLDIVTTIMPAYAQTTSPPTDAELCAAITCTRIFLGSTSGAFTEKTGTNLAHHSVYSDPTATTKNYWRRPFVGDLNGDGMADLLVDTGTFISNGDGNFDLRGEGASTYPGCQNLLDFNGDGKMDCLTQVSESAGAQYMSVSTGNIVPVGIGNFNLIASGDELYGVVAGTTIQNAGISLVDVDGDGRTDILRWKDDPSKNMVYLSNGDGTFRTSNFNLTTSNDRLQHSDGTVAYLVGDFTGNGNAEILRMVANPTNTGAGRNVLYVRPTSSPPDFLASVKTAGGQTTQLSWTSLSGSGSGQLGKRYYSDSKTSYAASYPVYDLMLPMYVVATATTDVGSGPGSLVTEYRYGGLKAAYDGRGWLGFREVRRQTTAPDGSALTVTAQYLQDGLNSGAVSRSVTWSGDLNRADAAPYLSRSSFVYCDRTSATSTEASATPTAPCPTASLVRRPYLYQSVEEGWEPGAAGSNELPSVTTQNKFNDSGDATQIVVTTRGTAVGLSQTSTKTVVNAYFANDTSGDNWMLGRLQKTTVSNVVPDALSSIASSPGGAPNATATSGVLMSAVVSPSPLIISSTLATASGSATVTAAGGAAPYTFSWIKLSGTRSSINSSTAASPVFTASLVPGDNFVETWQVTARDTGGKTATTAVNVNFVMPAVALAASASASPSTVSLSSPGLASGTATATATGGKAPYTYAWTRVSGTRLSISDSTVQSPSFSATLTVGDNFSETWKVTVTDADMKTASANVTLRFVGPTALAVSISPASLNLSAATAGVVSGTVQANASGGASPYTYSWGRISGSRSSVSSSTIYNPTISASVIANDNFAETWRVTVTDAGGQTASAQLTANFTGPTASPALALLNCATVSPTISPTTATTTCDVKNTGSGTASSISYASSTIPNVTITGPTGSCAAGTVCGSVVVRTASSPGTYAGTLTATPNTGTAASTSISLRVDAGTPSVSVSPTSYNFGSFSFMGTASTMITVTNSGNGPATGVGLSLSQTTSTSGGMFSYIDNGCAGSIAAGASCTVRVTYEANCIAKGYTGYLNIAGSNFSSLSVPLYATTMAKGVCLLLVTPPPEEVQ